MVGAGVISLLILVGIIPRMAQISNTRSFINFYEKILVIGTFLGALISIQNISISIGKIGVIVFGLSYGIFVGFLSSGLAEILDYIPIASRRLKIPTLYLKYIIISLLIGKVIGSFIVGGIICVIGQIINDLYSKVGNLDKIPASTATSITLIFIGAFLTGLGVYDLIGKRAGAGSIIPITGFANSIVSPAMEYKREGFVLGVGANLFKIAGPVLVYGIGSSIIC